MQSQTTEKHHFTTMRTAVIKKTDHHTCGEYVEKPEPSHNCGDVKWSGRCGKQPGRSSNIKHADLTCNPAVPLLGKYSGEMETHMNTKACTRMLTAALFTIPKRWKQPKGPSVTNWINKRWPVHPVEYYSAIKKERSTDRYYIMDEPWNHRAKWKKPDTKSHILYDSTYMKCPE